MHTLGHIYNLPLMASGEKTQARAILAAIRALSEIERDLRPATPDERETLMRFAGFGKVALSLFPNPVTGRYKDESWQELGDELRTLLSPEEYDSAKRTTFTAFYTSPVVIGAMYDALAYLGVPEQATVLEPGCGNGRFIGQAPDAMRFIGVELDSLSGRIARALHPGQDIRIENFRDTRLPEGRIDAVIGNVPFADIRLDYGGQRLPLHDYFLAKSLDALKPGGVLALITSHYTLDKQNAALREHMAERADFLGAIRLPSNAFKQEGTQVVTDILFLHKREAGASPRHAHDGWLETAPLTLEGIDIPINRYFLEHPEMVLGAWSRENRLYGSEATYSVTGAGDLAAKLQNAIAHLPKGVFSGMVDPGRAPPAATAFTPPPLLPHVDEGSFYVGDDQTLLQVQAGEAVPVTHGDTPLKAGGTMMGRRLAALVSLRDQARRVLQSQNEDWPESHRHEARRQLNRLYGRFVGTYGPVNKTTISVTANGTTVRRMPNLVKFRDDPDAMLVMSLEHYDEATDTAEKAAIMHQDVVGRSPPVTEVQSAEDGLLVSLDQLGKVDLPYIENLYKAPQPRIIAELGDLIYQDPDTNEWETADVYLSGNVRAKLAAAEKAGPAFARNLEALRRVQPEDVLPGDIDANLGAPWIPEADIEAFAAHLFGVEVDSIQVAHLKKDAVWSIDADLSAVMSVAASTDYGTERTSGVKLLEQALNLKSPAIYDTVMAGGQEERVLNQEATLAAREKQKRIKESFRSWIFEGPERTERLVRLYNDTYNNIRLRLFDGSHLEFPGMNRTIALQQHQKDAVWRCMSSGNALLAHAVGAGKTYEMAAAGMKMKQAGLIKKPMYVVPNHMLEQFARECLQLYPNARFLIAGKEDLARARRKLLTAKIASGDWDGIVVTHSSFERIGMSRDYQAEFLREQIAEYEQLLCDSAGADAGRARRNIIKTIEKQKARREERLQDLLAEDKKDDGLVFDELGVDHLFIDESHYYKNLETPTKMDRVAGIQTGSSERAFDLFMKARYLHRQHAGHGLTFATGTPISNTMVEMYTVQRYLDPDGLSSRGIDHFDAWAATFGEVVETMEISPDGKSLRPRSRFARFTNLPELQQMFRTVADVQTAEMLDLPRPKLKGGKATVISCPMSETQRLIQDQLVERYDRLRTQKVDPREDNALAITTDGRKLSLDARLIAPADDYPGSKINALVETVTALWQQTANTRGTQMIFSDMGVHPTPWGYSVYEDLMDKLVRNGIPREQIAAVGDADTDAKKQVLFDKVRAGIVRILIGSTQKMGTGTNVQKRLVALHHLDAPWKPAEVEQRDGRILRQGNLNAEVSIYRYVTEGSFDAYMWQALETKARFIAQVITGDSTARQAEDIGGQELSYAEVKAIASGNPAVLTLAEADAELKRLTLLKKHHGDEQYLARQALRELPQKIDRLERRLAGLAQDMETAEAHQADPLIIDGRPCPKDDVQKLLAQRLKTVSTAVIETRRIPLGGYRGLDFGLALSPFDAPDVYIEGATTRRIGLSRDHQGPRAILNALERLVSTYDLELGKTARDLDIARGQLRDFEARHGARFVHEAYLDELTSLRNQLELGLSGTAAVDEIVARIMDLRAAHTVEAAPSRTVRVAAAEEPVTARIKQRAQPQPEPASNEEAETPAPQAPQSPLATLFNLPPEAKPQHMHTRRSPHRKQRETSSQLSLF